MRVDEIIEAIEELPVEDQMLFFNESATEKENIEYAVEAFKECKTLEDFQEKYREIENRSFNFIPAIGLK